MLPEDARRPDGDDLEQTRVGAVDQDLYRTGETLGPELLGSDAYATVDAMGIEELDVGAHGEKKEDLLRRLGERFGGSHS